VDPSPPRPSPADFDHYGISVTDLARSVEFYRDILGGIVILPPHPVDEFGFRRAVIYLNDCLGIDLNQHARNGAESFDHARTGLDHLAFGVTSHDALLDWRAYLDAHGLACSPLREVDGVGEAFDFRDPDGIPIEFWHYDLDGSWRAYVNQKLQARTPTLG
jgi:glyoxylase I family protein